MRQTDANSPSTERGASRRSPRLWRSPWASLGIATLAALATGAIALAAALLLRPPVFAATVLDPPRDLLDFQLTDHLGRTTRLSDLSRGVVVLTFLYTHCPDACPLTTAKLHQTYTLLGKDASRVTLLAVTVDPERDTQARLRDYSQEKDMQDKWRFLTGTEAQLKPLWDYYWAAPLRAEATGDQKPPPADSAYLVEHSVPIHLIARGQVRAVFGEDFQPSELAHDLRLLLR